MTATMDIVVGYDSSLLITMDKMKIQNTIESVTNHVPSINQNHIRMSLIEYQSHINGFSTRTHPFTTSKEQFLGWVDAVPTDSVTEKSCKAIVDVLAECLTLDWRPKMPEYSDTEKLVILFVSGPPCNLLNDDCCTNGRDLWKIADQLAEKDIVLVIVDLEPAMTIYEDFYCALAKRTGGQYLPVVNAPRVLSFVVRKAIHEWCSLSRLFYNLDIDFIERGSKHKYKYCASRVMFMLKNCHTMDDIREQLYTFKRGTYEVINGESFEFGSLADEHSFIDRLDEHDLAIASTPIAISDDDEGYLSQMPTTASSVSSMINSPIFYDDHEELILINNSI